MMLHMVTIVKGLYITVTQPLRMQCFCAGRKGNHSPLPTSIKNTSHDIKKFRSVLKSFLIINSFYLLKE